VNVFDRYREFVRGQFRVKTLGFAAVHKDVDAVCCTPGFVCKRWQEPVIQFFAPRWVILMGLVIEKQNGV
jgi:hypothetical protein